MGGKERGVDGRRGDRSRWEGMGGEGRVGEG